MSIATATYGLTVEPSASMDQMYHLTIGSGYSIVDGCYTAAGNILWTTGRWYYKCTGNPLVATNWTLHEAPVPSGYSWGDTVSISGNPSGNNVHILTQDAMYSWVVNVSNNTMVNSTPYAWSGRSIYPRLYSGTSATNSAITKHHSFSNGYYVMNGYNGYSSTSANMSIIYSTNGTSWSTTTMSGSGAYTNGWGTSGLGHFMAGGLAGRMWLKNNPAANTAPSGWVSGVVSGTPGTTALGSACAGIYNNSQAKAQVVCRASGSYLYTSLQTGNTLASFTRNTSQTFSSITGVENFNPLRFGWGASAPNKYGYIAMNSSNIFYIYGSPAGTWSVSNTTLPSISYWRYIVLLGYNSTIYCAITDRSSSIFIASL